MNDTERLDWLERTGREYERLAPDDDDANDVLWRFSIEPPFGTKWNNEPAFTTLREAIDTAMAKEEE